MKSYYLMFDISVPYSDKNHAVYFSVSDNSDVFGLVWLFIDAYHRDPNNVRLFRFPTKKSWELSRTHWLNAIYAS